MNNPSDESKSLRDLSYAELVQYIEQHLTHATRPRSRLVTDLVSTGMTRSEADELVRSIENDAQEKIRAFEMIRQLFQSGTTDPQVFVQKLMENGLSQSEANDIVQNMLNEVSPAHFHENQVHQALMNQNPEQVMANLVESGMSRTEAENTVREVVRKSDILTWEKQNYLNESARIAQNLYTYTSLSILRYALMFCFIMIIAIDLWGLRNTFRLQDFYHRVEINEPVTNAEAESIDNETILIFGIYVVTFLVTGILFWIWLYNARKNVGIWTTELRFKPIWVVGGFLVPLLNLWRPYQVTKEVWQASSPDHDPGTWQNSPSTIVGWWWFFYVINTGVSRASASQSSQASTLEENISAVNFLVFAYAIEIVTILIVLNLVWSLSQRQGQKYQLLQSIYGGTN